MRHLRHLRLLRSFRARLLLGSILWTIGLLFVAQLLAVFFVHWYYDGHVIAISRVTFRTWMGVLVATALVSMIAGFRQVRKGLSALDQVRARLAAVRSGAAKRIEGTHPSEVQPLVQDLNALLDHREATVRRARTKAADLAHGLKTPLALLAHEADRAEAAGQPESAAAIRLQVEKMRRQIDYQLAHVGAVASGATPGARCSVKDCAAGILRALEHLHAERNLLFDVRIGAELAVRVEAEDLEEMLGNLLDNACKWARSRVVVASEQVTGPVGPVVLITIDDDGPGLDPALRQQVLERGVRADEAAPGSGLGLSIVRDLAELHGGEIRLAPSPLGGLRARLSLPAA
jgi:signal transduction histidine kinase